MPDVPARPRRLLGASVAALLVLSTTPVVAASATDPAPASSATAASPAASTAASRAGTPTHPGGVALTWSPAYMTGSHAFTAEHAQRMARKFDLVAAMPYPFKDYAAAMRAANPDLTLLAYSNAILASPSYLHDLPETAFAHDRYGDRIVSSDWDEHLMETSSPAWRDRADEMCTERAARGGFDGCLVDLLTLGVFSDDGLGSIPVNPATEQPYTQAEYRQQLIEVAAHYRRRSPELIHLGNTIENAYRYWRAPVSSRPIATSQPGAQMEDFLRGAFNPVDRFPSAVDWERNVDVIRDLHRSGATGLFSTKLWPAGGTTDAQVARWQAYATASFLMGADGTSYFSFSRSRDVAGVVHANVPYSMPKDIGDPLGAMTRRTDGAWVRRFSNGMSVVNPTTATVTIALPAPMRALDGRTTTSLTLGPSTGEVLVGDAPSAPEPTPAPTSDTRAPAVTLSDARFARGALRYAGGVRDDRAVARVLVAVRNERTGRWRQADGTWGRYTLLPTTLQRRAADAGRWSRQVQVRRPGRYGVSVVGVDRAGNRSTTRPWRVVRVP